MYKCRGHGAELYLLFARLWISTAAFGAEDALRLRLGAAAKVSWTFITEHFVCTPTLVERVPFVVCMPVEFTFGASVWVSSCFTSTVFVLVVPQTKHLSGSISVCVIAAAIRLPPLCDSRLLKAWSAVLPFLPSNSNLSTPLFLIKRNWTLTPLASIPAFS